MDSRFYSCRKCGVIVGLVEGSPETLTCDGAPVEMIRAIRKVVHEGFTGKEAFEFFTDAINK